MNPVAKHMRVNRATVIPDKRSKLRSMWDEIDAYDPTDTSWVVMGYRSAASVCGAAVLPVKDSFGKVVYYATKEEAEAKAAHYNSRLSSSNVKYRAEMY